MSAAHDPDDVPCLDLDAKLLGATELEQAVRAALEPILARYLDPPTCRACVARMVVGALAAPIGEHGAYLVDDADPETYAHYVQFLMAALMTGKALRAQLERGGHRAH